ncbi:MAG TPA: 50S ribosomal protein L25 [Actinomycetota bacterium]|nr:50S ribosomal protein L25 [Actinomycetota bacterium]
MEVTIQAEERAGTGKGVARKLRAVGKVPAVVYGRGMDPVAVAVDRMSLIRAFKTDAGRNVLIDLQFAGDTHLTLARELQRDPVRGTILHVDFLKIARDVAIEVDVPIHIEGEAPGVKEGGVIEHHLWSVRVTCLPGNVPERLDADVSNMVIGDMLRVADLRVPEGVTVLTNPEDAVLGVVVPQILKVEEEVPAEAVEGVEGEEAVAEGAEGEAAAPAEGAEGAAKEEEEG